MFYMNRLVSIFSLFTALLFSSTVIELPAQSTDFIIKKDAMEFIDVELSSGDLTLDLINTELGDFFKISLSGYHASSEIGLPELPQIHRLIEIPQSCNPRIEILSETINYYKLSDYGINDPIIPFQRSLSKSETSEDLEFSINSMIYSKDSFLNRDLISIDLEGMLRSLRFANLKIRPIDYNPVTGILKVWENVKFRVHYDNANFLKTEDIKAKYYSPYFQTVYNKISNLKQTFKTDDLVNYPVTYLIITNPIFESALSEFIDWKTEKGFKVVLGNTADIGSSNSAIKNYIQNLYDNPTSDTPAPSFVLFVGDVAQMPTYSGSTGSHVTDLYYVEMTGDLVPDIYHGRFSAQNISQLESQISKTLEYEKFQMPDPSYLEEVLMVSGVDGSYAATHGNGQINYGNDYYFNEDHGIVSQTYLYPASDAPSAAAAIIQYYSQGVGFANYTAHCSSSGWADPSFTVSDVPGLYNNNKYNLMIGNCCTSTAFDVNSFGEAVLQVENRGAVGYIGGTNSTYWNEDFWWGVGAGTVSANPTYEATGSGVYDGVFHENGEDEAKWFIVNDAITMAGNLAVVEAGGSLISYYWEIYHNMGDPSVMTYMGFPDENNVNHLPILQIGTDVFTVSADPYSHIAISMNGVLYGSAFTGEQSTVDVNLIPFEIAGTASVVVTGQNKQPYFGTVEVGNADGPYLVVENFTIMTSDGNDIIEFGESVNVSIALKNVGSQITENVSINLAINDPYVTLLDSQEQFGDIYPDEIVDSNNSFLLDISTEIPNNYSIVLVATISGSSMEWQYNLNMTGYCPDLIIDGIVAGDEDGQLDPGDISDIQVNIYNGGGASLENVVVSIASSDEYITINGSPDFSIEGVEANSIFSTEYNISASQDAPIGHIAVFDIAVNASSLYQELLTGSVSIGLTIEDFEAGTLVSMPWNNLGDSDWEITTDAYEGEYSSVSGVVTHNQTSELALTANVTASDNITFFAKVSSEGSYDYLRFFIDGNELGSWSGEMDWTEVSYPVGSGEHTFRWVYSKDGSVDSGSDRGWVDYIIFPPIGPPAFSEIDISQEQLNVNLDANSEIMEQFSITNLGDGELQYTIEVVLDSPESPVQYESLKIEKGEVDPRNGISPMRESGGPDAFGYTWIDSDDLEGPSPTWIEIDYCGIPIGNADDSNEGPFELGFPFYFYGNEYSSVRVSTNGFISFTSSATSYNNQPIPANDDPNAVLAPFWDDLNPANGGQMYYFPWGDHFVVEWDEIPLYSGNGVATFQAVIYADGRILFNYKSVPALASNSCTVGIENEAGTDGLQVIFNSNYLHDDMTILFKSDYLQPWLNVFPLSGTLAADEASIISATFNTEELSDGIYTGNLNIYSNDPDQINTILPVTMSVGSDCGVVGDLDNDGEVSILDIIKLINCILNDDCGQCYDINNDVSVNIQDIIILVNIILE